MSTHVTNSIPATLHDLLAKLKILSMLESGMKINMSDLTFADASSWMDAIRRGRKGEGKKNLIVHLNQIIGQAITAIAEYQYTEFCPIIVNYLAQARMGIQSLLTTYSKHPKTMADISVCLDNIDIQLRKNQQLLNGHQILSKKPDNKEQLLPRKSEPESDEEELHM